MSDRNDKKSINVTAFKAQCLALIAEVTEGKASRVVLTRLGRLDETRARAQEFLAVSPRFTLSAWRPLLPHHAPVADALVGLLRQAGLPE